MIPYPRYSFRLRFWSFCCYSIGDVLAVAFLPAFARKSAWLALNPRVCDHGLAHADANLGLRLLRVGCSGDALRLVGAWLGANRGQELLGPSWLSFQTYYYKSRNRSSDYFNIQQPGSKILGTYQDKRWPDPILLRRGQKVRLSLNSQQAKEMSLLCFLFALSIFFQPQIL